MRRILCDGCRDVINPIVPFLELRPNGLTAFLNTKHLGPWYFCTYDCLAKWTKGRLTGAEEAVG